VRDVVRKYKLLQLGVSLTEQEKYSFDELDELLALKEEIDEKEAEEAEKNGGA